MERIVPMKTRFAQLMLALTLWFTGLALAQQTLASQVAGNWRSSSGTPIMILESRTDDTGGQRANLSINEGSAIDLWLNGDRDGNVILTYTLPDGTPMTGKLNEANQTITVTSAKGFRATWHRE
jgi:hypothetical protein